jgi:hydrogenase expression/formation protein HypE
MSSFVSRPVKPHIRAVLFDFDGTLTRPGTLDFTAIRQAMGCARGKPILEFINTLPTEEARVRAKRILDSREMEAAERSLPNQGAEELIDYIRSRKLKLGILSRNSAAAIRRALRNFTHTRASDFDVIITRDDVARPKPDPDAVLLASRHMGVPAESVLAVGDLVYDIQAGRRAGARTVFLTNEGSSPVCEEEPDHTVTCLEDIRDILDLSVPLPPGKLPGRFLARFLSRRSSSDDALLIAPGVGEDVAAISLANEEVLVVKADPITFATESIAHYAIMINLNDVATSGAVGRWLQTTLLFPVGSTAEDCLAVMQGLDELCLQTGLVLCGGHTEITDAVSRPIVSAQVIGTVDKRRLIDKKKIRTGNRILVTKRLALEGTSIVAREFQVLLQKLGVTEVEIQSCRNLLISPGISIRREAEIAASSGKATAMHDITEGGFSTAVEEVSIAGGHRIRIYCGRIPILAETSRICSLLGLNPLGLIASGSLLICCDAAAAESLAESIRQAGVEATIVGEVLEPGTGVEAVDDSGRESSWPTFETDEITRLFNNA